MSFFKEKLACERVDNGAGERLTGDTHSKSELFVVLVASYGIEVVSLGIEEQGVHENLRRFNDSGFARTELCVDFLQRFVTD